MVKWSTLAEEWCKAQDDKEFTLSAQRGKVSEQDIIDWVHRNMAAYKSPRIVQFVEALPKSATGKVMWRALQEKEAAGPA